MPLHRNEGLFAYIGQEINRGYLPYKDVLDNKPPLLFYTYWLAFKVMGKETPEVVRGLGFVFTFFTSLLLYSCAEKLRQGSGLWTAILFAVFSLELKVEGFSAESEVFMNFFLVLALFPLLYSSFKMSKFWLSSLGIGLAFLYKQVALLYLIPLWIYIYLKQRQKFIPLFALSLSGFMLPLLLFIFYFLSKKALGDFLQAIFYINYFYTISAHLTTFEYLKQIINSLITLAQINWWLTFWVLSLPVILLIKREKLLAEEVLMYIFLICSWLAVIPSKRFFNYYFISSLPFLTFIAVYNLYRLKNFISFQKWKILLFLSGIMLGITMKENHLWGLNLKPQEISSFATGQSVFYDASEVANYIASHTSSDAYIYNWGVEWELYFYTKRRAPTRYINTLFLFIFAQSHREGKFPTQKWISLQKEYWQDILTHPPQYIILTTRLFDLGDKDFFIPQKILQLLSKNYKLENTFPPFFALYRFTLKKIKRNCFL